MRRLIALALLLLTACLAASPSRAEDTLAAVKQKGTLVVGVKNDYRPWGFIDPSGQVVGLEIDLAREVADKIGVKLELVPVTAVNRMEFLRQGRIDLIIATLGDTPERRKIIGMVEPNYFAGATNVLALKSAGLKQWSDLKGRKVCAVQGAYYNRRVAQLYEPDMVVFPAVPDGLNALAAGNCVAFLFDDTLIESTLSAGDPKWANYEMPLPSEDPQLWAMGVRLDDLDGPFGKLLSQMSTDWLKRGHIIALEAKWGIKPSPYLQEMQQKLAGK
ncbi:MAG: transporter substrate-binding domain-containing protein [Acetobacteraceae bacterium]|jgi:polar amino acid transport system substrate-binding protein